MIDSIKYSDDISLIIFDEPIREYYDIMLKAATDRKSPLKDNYKSNTLSCCYFMSILTYKGEPHCIYGLEKTPWEKAARAFFRLYIPPLVFRYNGIDGSIIFNTYHNHPEYHQKYGIETLFFTRETYLKPFRANKYNFKDNWIKQEKPYMYNHVPQWVWVLGSNRFLENCEQV